MKMRNKVLLGVFSVALASAASFPNEVGAFYLGPTNWQQRQALATCQQHSSTFIAFLASDRENCFSSLRTAGDEHTGLWSRHDHSTQRRVQG
ncbi:MAG: hypothetical protein JO001_01990 [Alphaproteobacteria bacterium]|nr:hypothetical protein [Alphaproteobacteria bacterium]